MQILIDKAVHMSWSLWRFRWTALASAWGLCLLGWLLVASLEHRYDASAKMYIDTNQVLAPLLKDLAVQPDVKNQISLMSRAIMNRPNLEKLIDSTALKDEIEEPEHRDLIIARLQKRIALFDTSGASSLYGISYSHKDKATAKEVVENLVQIFIDSTLGEEREDNSSSIAFFDRRIAEYEARLEESENRLSSFKRKNAGSMPGEESGGFYQRLQGTLRDRNQARLLFEEAVNRRNSLRAQLQSETASIEGGSGGSSPIDLRIQAAQDKLDQLLLRFTDRHPQVALLRESIAELKAQKREAIASGRQITDLQSSVVYQKLRTLLAESEATAAEMSARVRNYDKQVAELRETVDSIPQVEAELAQLDREYSTIKANHDELLARREAARLTEAVDENTGDFKIRLTDPPFVKSRPTVPNKMIMTILVGLFGIAASIGMVLLFAVIKPIFFTQRSLSSSLNLPVLGTVSYVDSPDELGKKKAGRIVFGAGTVGLLGLTALLVLLQLRGIELEHLLPSDKKATQEAVYQAPTVDVIKTSALDSSVTLVLGGAS